MKKTLVWDLPIRIFHWCMALTFVLAWLLSEDLYLDIHVFLGYTFFGLLMFRLWWGWYGGRHARFRSFSYDWHSVSAYLKGLLTGQAARFVGHNPVGSWAIFLMLLSGLLITVTGFITEGGEEAHGWAQYVVSAHVGMTFHGVHEWIAWFMLAVVVVHVMGVVVESLLHKENLVWTMISGYKMAPDGEGHASVPRRGVAVLLLFLLLGGGTYYFQGEYKAYVKSQPYIPFKGRQLADNATWREECGDCHMAFHPSLLPRRSWQALMAGQHEHFDEDLDLDQDVVDEVLAFLVKNAAEAGATEPARKVLRSITKDQTPMRVTKVPYWVDKHSAIPASYYKKHPKIGSVSNCSACHLDAEQGTYEDAAMRMPDADSIEPPGLWDFLTH